MSDQSRDIPWVNSRLFTENRNQVPAEEVVKYVGLHVAWSMDGTRILASGNDEIEVDQRLRQADIDPSRVVFDFIPPPDVCLLGGFYEIGYP
jgi:hypothetical protein